VARAFVPTGHFRVQIWANAASTHTLLDAEGKAQLRPVTVGDWVGKDWAILDGLKQGDKVVVDNLLKLRPGAAVTPAAGA